jgi:3-phosphoshikimate 1-carboxyvinyltransferase
MGAAITTAEGGKLPAMIEGRQLTSYRYVLPMPSAQVKSALLLAGLGAEVEVTITEPVKTRDHTERMLRAFGGEVRQAGDDVTFMPGQTLRATELTIPADPSSAAFPMVAALVTSGSEVVLRDVMQNPRRTGLIGVLRRMGATIDTSNLRSIGGEDVADLTVRSSVLGSTLVEGREVPDMIDEIPILAVAAAFASGTTRIEGLEELKVKESDRLAATARVLREGGVVCRTGEDWLEIDGCAEGQVRGGGEVDTDHDHRIGMAALVLGLGAEDRMRIKGAEAVATSFPGFGHAMTQLGAAMETA